MKHMTCQMSFFDSTNYFATLLLSLLAWQVLGCMSGGWHLFFDKRFCNIGGRDKLEKLIRIWVTSLFFRFINRSARSTTCHPSNHSFILRKERTRKGTYSPFTWWTGWYMFNIQVLPLSHTFPTFYLTPRQQTKIKKTFTPSEPYRASFSQFLFVCFRELLAIPVWTVYISR